MSTLHEERPHLITFVWTNGTNWYTKSIPPLMIELAFNSTESIWQVTARSVNREFDWSFRSSSMRHNMILEPLLSQKGLPMKLGITSNPNWTLYDVYGSFRFQWYPESSSEHKRDASSNKPKESTRKKTQNHTANAPRISAKPSSTPLNRPVQKNLLGTEKITPAVPAKDLSVQPDKTAELRPLKLEKTMTSKPIKSTSNQPIRKLTFIRQSERVWRYDSDYFRIEATNLGTDWIVVCIPKIFEDETFERPIVQVRHKDQNKAVSLLFMEDGITSSMGLSANEMSVLKQYRGSRVGWKMPSTPHLKRKKQKSLCPYHNLTKHCDNSFDCSFCSSSGSAYFRRSDD